MNAARLVLPVPLALPARQALPVRLAPQVRLAPLVPQELRELQALRRAVS